VVRTDFKELQCPYNTAILLLHLLAVQFLENFSAGKTHITFFSHCGLYGLYRISVPVHYSLISTPPMVRTHPRLLSACKISYISTSPVGGTACTELQFLYSTSIHLLPLWTLQPVKFLTACIVHLHPYNTYRHYSLYRALLPVHYSYISTPLCAVRPSKSLSACTIQLWFY